MTIEELRVIISAKTEPLQQGIQKVKNRLNDLSVSSNKSTEALRSNAQKASSSFDQLVKKLDNVNAQAELQARKLNKLREQYSRMSSLGSDSPKAIKLQEQILRTESALDKLISKSDETAEKIRKIQDGFSATSKTTERANQSLKRSSELIKKLGRNFKETGHRARDATGTAAAFGNTLSRSLMSVMKRIFVYNLIYRAIRGLMGYMNGALQTNSKFVNSLNTIQTNLRVAFQPIYEFILPALNALMSALATITGYIASLTSALFGKTFTQSKDAAKGLNAATKAMDGYGASAKEAKGQLAAFDEINLIETTPDAGGGGGGGGGAGGFEWTDAEIPEYNFTWLEKLKEKLGPTIEALGRLKEALQPLKEFVAQGLIDFYDKFLVPVGNWVFGEGIPRFIDAISNGLAKIDWERINQALATLWEALAPFAINVGEGLLWLWENVLVPLGTWVGNEIVPRFLDLLAAVLKILNTVIEIFKPLGIWLWEEFLKPLAEWTGGIILAVLDGIIAALEKFSGWMEKNQRLIQNITIVIGAFMAAWAIVNLVIKIAEIVGALATFISTGGLAAAAATVLGAAIAFITSPITLAIAAIALLIIAGIALYKNWDEVKEKLKAAWEAIKTKAKEIWEPIRDFFVETWDTVSKKTVDTWNTVKDFLINRIWNPIKETARTVWEGIKKYIIDPITDTWNKLKTLWDNIKSTVLTKWDEIKTGILNKKDALVDAVKSPFETAKDWIDGVVKDAKDWGKNMMDNIKDGIESKIDSVKRAARRVADTISDYLGFSSPTKKGPGSKADRWMPNMVDMLADGIKDNVYKIDTSVGMAADTLSKVKGTNADSIASAVGSAMMSAMQFNEGADSGREVVIELDGTKLGRVLLPKLNQEADRLGYKPILQTE